MALTAMSAVSAALSAAYVTLAGRMLGPEEYGSLATLLALAAGASLFLAPLETAVAKIVAEHHAQGNLGQTHGLLRGSMLRGTAYLLAATLLAAPCFAYLRDALNLRTSWDLVVFTAYVTAWLWMSCLRGGLRGDHRFAALGTTLAVESATRLGLGVTWIWLSRSAVAGIGGYFLGMLLAVLCALWQLRDLRKHVPVRTDLGRLASLSGNTFFLFLYIQTAMSLDMVVAKRALSPLDSGFYAACSTIAKLLVVAASPLLSVLFSRVSAMHAEGKPTGRVVRWAVFGSAAALLLSLLIPWLLGGPMLRLLFGVAFDGDAKTLNVLWLTAAVLVPQYALGLSLVATNRARPAWTLAVPPVLLISLLLAFHQTALQVALCGLAASLSASVPLGLMSWASARAPARTL